MKWIMTLLFAASFVPFLSFSSHLRCGYISVDRVSSTSYLCRITVTAYTSSSSVTFGGGTLSFGGLHIEVPQIPSEPRPDLGPGIGVAIYSIEHQYAGPGTYSVSYSELNRNGGIINLNNSLTTAFYIETHFSLDPFLGAFDTPKFLFDPYFTAKLGSNLSLSIGAVGTDDDQFITYQLAAPGPPGQYHLPENFHVNPNNGLITWDTKFQGNYTAGEYLFTVKVHLWKKIDNSDHRLCTITRDFQIILTDDGEEGGISDNGDLDENNRIYLPENESQTIKIFYQPNLEDYTTLTAFAEIADNGDVFSFTTYDSIGENIKVGVLTLTAKASIDRGNPYIITVRGAHQNEGSPHFASDLVYMFYTRDLYPGIITRTEDGLPGLKIYPNPVTDFLNIHVDNGKTVSLLVFDSSGKVILQKLIHGPEAIDLRHVNKGVYFFRVMTGNSGRVVKIVKH